MMGRLPNLLEKYDIPKCEDTSMLRIIILIHNQK
jgi:hypothetical protein